MLAYLKSSSRGGATAVIWGASPQMRCERKKDRVEVNPELLAAASAQAEISFFCLHFYFFEILLVLCGVMFGFLGGLDLTPFRTK